MQEKVCTGWPINVLRQSLLIVSSYWLGIPTAFIHMVNQSLLSFYTCFRVMELYFLTFKLLRSWEKYICVYLYRAWVYSTMTDHTKDLSLLHLSQTIRNGGVLQCTCIPNRWIVARENQFSYLCSSLNRFMNKSITSHCWFQHNLQKHRPCCSLSVCLIGKETMPTCWGGLIVLHRESNCLHHISYFTECLVCIYVLLYTGQDDHTCSIRFSKAFGCLYWVGSATRSDLHHKQEAQINIKETLPGMTIEIQIHLCNSGANTVLWGDNT